MPVSRQPKGIPVGGQYAENSHDEAPTLDRTIGRHTVTPGVWDDRARAMYLGEQKMALAVALSRAFGGNGKVIVRFDEDGDRDRAQAIFAETEDGFVVNADGWQNKIDALGVEYPYEHRDLDSTPEDWISYDDTADQDYDLAETFVGHFSESRPPEDPEPWFGNYERDRRYADSFDARSTGSAGTVYDPRILDRRE